MTVFFTADTHFSHRSMVERKWRPQYSTVAEMDEDLIARWNETVGPKDVVWHLGDWALGNPVQHLTLVNRLHGRKHLVTGNHDKCWPAFRDAHAWQQAFLEAGFASVQAFARRRVLGKSVLLNHFPYEVDDRHQDLFSEYRPVDTGLWLLHGHVHTEWRVRGRQINVGVDAPGNDFRPVSLEQITAIIEESE